MKSKKIRLIAKGLFSVLGISGFCFSVQGATGIQGCLENYQGFDRTEEDRVARHNQKVEADRVASVMPPLRNIHGPGHYCDVGDGSPPYIVMCYVTAGTLPLVHLGAQVAYQIPRYVFPALANASHRVGAAIKKATFHPAYEKEIHLIQDFIQLGNADQIILSKIFRKISKNPGVKKRYPDDKKVYDILKAAFDSKYVCRDGEPPHSLSRIVGDLRKGYLGRAVGIPDELPISNFPPQYADIATYSSSVKTGADGESDGAGVGADIKD